MKKYLLTMKSVGLDYQHSLREAKWRKDFRVLDLSKRAFVEQDPDEGAVICLKFPYAFKRIYEKDFLSSSRGQRYNRWDHDKKINRIPVRKCNIIQLHELLKFHNFEIDESFLNAVDVVEEIWQQSNSVEPYAVEHDGKIYLRNCSSDAESYWESKKTGQRNKDLWLAKSMGFVFKPQQTDGGVIDKICSSNFTDFWCADFDKFFEIYKKLDETIAIVLDNSNNYLEWLEKFVSSADLSHVDRNEIKVCFREEKTETDQRGLLNDWIRKNQVGGKVESGKIFVFKNRPAKWLFSGKIDVKLVATNSMFPMTNYLTQQWLSSKSCLIYLGDIKPSEIKERKIAKL
jgi:hypothetical protein